MGRLQQRQRQPRVSRPSSVCSSNARKLQSTSIIHRKVMQVISFSFNPFLPPALIPNSASGNSSTDEAKECGGMTRCRCTSVQVHPVVIGTWIRPPRRRQHPLNLMEAPCICTALAKLVASGLRDLGDPWGPMGTLEIRSITVPVCDFGLAPWLS